MRNINELIGVIKGINFDGIINEYEILRLQSWVDKNRNLAYTAEQVAIIKLVDEVLEDGIIDAEEQKTLLKYCDDFKENSDDSIKILYELNGIVEGLICDGEVNEAEIRRLKVWLDTYGEYIDVYETNKELYRVVNGILEDGIVTEQEKQIMFEILSERIDNSKFEIKLEYLCKKVKERENIGIDLIDMLDNYDAMETIHKRAIRQLGISLNSYSGLVRESEVIFISLCLIGMLEYDGTFYDSVRKTYAELYKKYSGQRIEGFIRTFLNRYRTEEDRVENSGVKNAIISVVLSNAIVPSHFLGAFFEFIFDIYKLNFEYDLPENLYDEFKYIYDELRTSMFSEGDSIQDSVTKKTYKLIKTTKNLIVDGESIDAVIKLSIIVVKLIDKKIWNKSIKIYNPYLKLGFDKWVATLKEDVICGGERSSSEWRSRWEPKFILLGNEVFLVPPVHRIKSSYNYWDIYVQVLSDGNVIFEEREPDIREIIAGYKISGNSIKIECPFNNISYRIMAGDRVIYDSHKKLYRKFIVFDKDGFEIHNNTDYKGTAIFCYRDKHEKLEEYYTSEGYKLAAQNIHYGDSYCVDSIIFNFAALIKPGVFGVDYENVYLMKDDKKTKLQIFKEIRYLVFENENESKIFEVLINNKPFKLSDFDCDVTEREGVTKYVVDLDIHDAGVYNVVVNQFQEGKKKRILLSEFVLDPRFDAILEKLNDMTFSYKIESALNGSGISGQIKLEEFNDETIKIEISNRVYYLGVPFDLDAYRISNAQWRTLANDIWIGDIGQDSILDIYDSSIDTVMVLSDKGSVLERIPLKDNGVYRRFNAGFLVSYREEYNYTLLVLLKEGKIKKGVYCNNKCIMRDGTELVFDTDQRILRIRPWYYGKGNVCCEIYDSKGACIYSSEKLENDVSICVSGLNSYEEYTISFYEKSKGLTLKKKRELKTFKRVFYAKEDFMGKELKISEVAYVDEAEMQQNYNLAKSYIRLLERKPDGSFGAEIYMKGNNPKLRSNLVKTVDVEIFSEVVNGELEMTVLKNNRLLSIDTDRRHVTDLASCKGPKAVSYTVLI